MVQGKIVRLSGKSRMGGGELGRSNGEVVQGRPLRNEVESDARPNGLTKGIKNADEREWTASSLYIPRTKGNLVTET